MELTYIFAVAAIAFYLYYVYLKNKNNPKLGFSELIYDRNSGRLELTLDNRGDRTYFVKPSLMVARLASASEWKEKTVNGNGVEMMEAKASNGCSVIEGYDLLGFHEDPVGIEPGKTEKFVYYLSNGMEVKAFDNIKVDLKYGFDSSMVDREIDANMTVKFDRIELDDDVIVDDIDEQFGFLQENEVLGFGHGALFDGGVDVISQELPLDGGIPEPFIEVPLDGCLADVRVRKELKECGFPIEATCFCCGKSMWLKWVFENQHVCDDCKDFLMEKYDLEEPEIVEVNNSHMEFIHLLRREDTLSLKEISAKLGKNKNFVNKNLNELLANDRVGRVKQGRSYFYFLNE